MHPRSAELTRIAAALDVTSTTDVIRNAKGEIIGTNVRATNAPALIASGQALVRAMKARGEIVPDHAEWLSAATKFLRAWALHDAERHDELVMFAAGLEGIAAAVTDGGIAPNLLLTGWVDERLN